jgi:hypothetical protein
LAAALEVGTTEQKVIKTLVQGVLVEALLGTGATEQHLVRELLDKGTMEEPALQIKLETEAVVAVLALLAGTVSQTILEVVQEVMVQIGYH